MRRRYTLQWLDSLINESLNPESANIEAILPEQLNGLKLQIEENKIEQQSFLQNEVFSLLEEDKIKLLIKQYHAALVFLLDQALGNYQRISNDKVVLKQLTNDVINCVDELLSFISARFPIYIGQNAYVPVTSLSQIRKESKKRTERIRTKLKRINDKSATEIVLEFLFTFSKADNDDSPVTFQNVLYVQDLLNELEALEIREYEDDIFSGIDKILISMNFNNEQYIGFLIQEILSRIKLLEHTNDKIDRLQFYLKEFNQLHRKAEVALQSKQTNLRDAILNWFSHEIFYLEKKHELSIDPFQEMPETKSLKVSVEKKKSKILCIFSTDQMGIMLRAFDELQVVKARSMNEVFKTIIPHLSTPYKVDLSYDSVRSKSYSAEERDKMIVIDTLKQAIDTIKRY